MLEQQGGHEGGIEAPTHGDPGSKNAELCARHAEEGMIDVHHTTCAHDDCGKSPAYGAAGTKRPEFCAQHVKQGMASSSSRRGAATPVATAGGFTA